MHGLVFVKLKKATEIIWFVYVLINSIGSGMEYKTCKVFDEELRHAKQNLGFDPSKLVDV
jgi:hypothetical protein